MVSNTGIDVNGFLNLHYYHLPKLMDLSIKEKIYGAIFGYAVGDALGLGTEFMTAMEVKRRYPTGLKNYSQIVRDAHRSQWKRGEWTNDTEMVLIMLESFLRCGKFDYIDIAKNLKKWYDSNPIDLTMNLRLVLKQDDFANHPFESTQEAWDKLGTFENSSECLGRAIFSFLSNDPVETASALCRLTHPRGRTIASCEVIATMTSSLFWNNRQATYEEMISIARQSNEDVARYIETARFGTIEDFHLDDHDTYWFVRKALGASLWCVWHCKSFEEGLDTVIKQGGDADTNAASAAALLGLKFGFSSIPQNLIDGLVSNERLFDVAEGIVKFLESKQ